MDELEQIREAGDFRVEFVYELIKLAHGAMP
jgi:hypothetical protein